MARFGEVNFDSFNDEEITKSNEISDHPTEDGATVSDNVDNNPVMISFNGIVQGEGAFERLQTLRKYSDDGELKTYVGRNVFNNMVILSLRTIHDDTIKGGFKFNIQLKQVQIAQLQTTNIDFGVVAPQTVNVNRDLGKKSIVELDPAEEDVLESDIIPYKIPTFTDVKQTINQKIELQNTKSRAAMKAQITKFKSDDRRLNRPGTYNGINASQILGRR